MGAQLASKTHQASTCPFLKLNDYACSDSKIGAPELMDGEVGKNMWSDKYTSTERCHLWWWAHYAQQWNYPPLSEWAQLMQDSIREGVAISVVAPQLKTPPKPPKQIADALDVAHVSCHRPTAAEQAVLNESLQQFSPNGLSSDLLRQLSDYCMAFEVGLPVWKKLGTQVQRAYVIPIGSMNLVVISQPRPFDSRVLASLTDTEAASERETLNNIVGECPVAQDPRLCIEDLIKPKDTPSFTLDGAAPTGLGKISRTMKAIPDSTGFEGLFAAHLKKPYDITISLEEGGDFLFSWKSPEGQVPLTLVAYDGALAFEADMPSCKSTVKQKAKVVLRPLAYGPALEELVNSIAIFDKKDFPAPPFTALGGSKHACSSESSYETWAATVANAARHYALHGVPLEEIFRFIAYQRARWDIEDEHSPPRTQKDVVFGAAREKQVETPLFSKFGYEAQAMKFIDDNVNNHGKSLLYRTIKIDGVPATEVWYYKKATRIWPLDPKSPRTNILLVHNKNAKAIMSRSVFSRLNLLANNCAPVEEVKGSYLKAVYALFNAVPLQAGEEVVNRVYVTASYQAIFGSRLRDPKKWVNVSADAWTMDLESFSQKYLPLL